MENSFLILFLSSSIILTLKGQSQGHFVSSTISDIDEERKLQQSSNHSAWGFTKVPWGLPEVFCDLTEVSWGLSEVSWDLTQVSWGRIEVSWGLIQVSWGRIEVT